MLNISKDIFVGWDSLKQKHVLPDAEIIPVGETSKELKKQESLSQKFGNVVEYENIPLPGFTLLKSDRKSWSSTDVSWLVIDPRGFLARISNSNLESIMHVTGITEGLIQEKCVWARENQNTSMILVPVSSPLYIEAVKNTEIFENRVNIKDVSIGDKVLLQNGLQGIYLGVQSLYGYLNDDSTGQYLKPSVYLRRQVVEIKPKQYHYQVDTKILKILKKSSVSITREEASEHINNEIATGGTYFSTGIAFGSPTYYSTRHTIRHVSTYAVPKPTLTIEEIEKDHAMDLFDYCLQTGDAGTLLLENSSGYYIIDYPHPYTNVPCSIKDFPVCNVVPNFGKGISSIELTKKRVFQWSQNTVPAIHRRNIDDFTNFYKITKHVKNETYQ